jgi:Domain of Unknown Function (DUF930)
MHMRKLGLAIGLATIMATQAAAASSREERFEHSLKMLSPIERLIQICDYSAMKKIGQADKVFRPDRAVGDARANAVVVKDTIAADGAAFRSHGKWYELSYTCTGTPDHLKVLSIQYRIGPEIPEKKWAAYHLW